MVHLPVAAESELATVAPTPSGIDPENAIVSPSNENCPDRHPDELPIASWGAVG